MQDEEYPIAWKSIEAGRVDYVNAIAEGKTEFPGFISFKTPSMPMASQPADKEAQKQVNLVGGIAGQTDQLIAFALKEDEEGNEIEHELGVLNLVSYAKVRNKVVLVPVNGATVPTDVKQEINAVFAQSVAEWDVVIDATYSVHPSVLEKLDEGESGMLASFPKNMRGFIQTFKQVRDGDKNAYYLFIIPGNKGKRAGFMPFKRQFGFIYPENTNNTARTIAHELGHGAFRLRHTFSPEAIIAGQGKTNNLMDYPPGPELRKYQWDNVHEPESMSGWFEDDAEVASYDASVTDIWKKNLYNLACASSRGESLADINVFYGLAKGKDSDGFRHPIKFEFYNSIEVEVKVYQLPAIKEYVLDLSTKSKVVSNGKVEVIYGLKGTASKVHFIVNSADAPLFESTISTPPSGLFQHLVDNIPESEGDAAYSVLSSLPVCAFELISAEKRIEYIDWMVQDEWITNEHQEDLIIRLLEEVPSSRVAELVSALESYSNWQDLFENFDNINTYQGLFRAFKNLYNATKTKEELEEVEAVFDFNLLKSASLSMDYTSKVDVAYSNSKVQIIREITTAQWTPLGLQNATTKSIPIGDLDVFAPVAVIVNDDHTNIGLQPGTELRSIPAILVAFLIEKKDSENNKELASTAVDIGLLIGGVGEINLAIKAYQEVRTVRTLFRLTLATADIATAYVDMACNSNDTELCQQWKEVAFYLQIGLLTFNAADGLEVLIKRSDNVVKAGDNVIDLAKAETRYSKTYSSASTRPYGLQMSLDEVEKVFGANGKKLVQEAERKAKEIVMQTGGNIQGDPVLTGLVDNKTGQIFYGRNLKTQSQIEDFMENLHPILKKRLDYHNNHLNKGILNAAATDVQRAGIPGSHSEIIAMDQALKARGASVTEADLADFIIHNKKLGGQIDNVGIPKGCPPRCAHCWYLSDDIKVIGND